MKMIRNRRLIDNSTEELSMKKHLREILGYDGIQTLRIATGYWDMKSLELLFTELKAFLEKDGTSFQLLLGKDPFVYASQIKNPTYSNYKYPDDFIRRNIDDLEFTEENERLIGLLLNYCKGDTPKISIRLYKKATEEDLQMLHSKCYIMTGNDGEDWGYGIVGSSNFTGRGLDVTGNAELNYLENEYRFINWKEEGVGKGHIQWFEERWENSEPWNEDFLEKVLRPTEIAKKVEKKQEEKEDIPAVPLTPYEVYIKLLQSKFGDLVDKNLENVIESYLPQRYDSYEYQMDAVKQCFSTMKAFGGFILADVVGLGKTIVGTWKSRARVTPCATGV